MSQYYNPRKTRNLFNPDSKNPHTISRSKIDLFLDCPRCFYYGERLGVGRPPGFPFNLNSAVDALLKKEFDIHRRHKSAHPLMSEYGIDAVPFAHEKMEEWRDALRRGVSSLHEPTNLFVRGGIDDVWVKPNGELLIVDYKATSKDGEVSVDAEWQEGYKRQIEVYQWLFRRNGFAVSDTGYFVYANASRDKEAFDGKLEFDVKVIPYKGSDTWVPGTLHDIRACLLKSTAPEPSAKCDYCNYRRAVGEVLRERENGIKEKNEIGGTATKKEKKSPGTLF
ncbi:MAG: PD-(D/E)XK nuclease family protein [Parcubacteria group bacterium]|nr:PD-(D/E)XK nuclease family protein [Parcubacteria group bacterium]